MEHSHLLRGLLQEQEQSIRQQIVLWDDATLWRTLWSKLKQKADSDLPIVDEIDSLITSSDDWDPLLFSGLHDFHLMKLCRLMEIADLKLPRSRSAVELNEVCLQLEDFAIDSLRNTDKTFDGNSLVELSSHTIKKLFKPFEEEFNNASEETKNEAASKLLKAIEGLNENDQQRLLDELGVDGFSTDILIKLISGGTFAGGFATLVSVAGFSAFTTLTSAIAAVSGLIGVTLPFSVYVTATSTLAFLINPYVIVAGGLGIGSWVTMKSNKAIRSQLLPILVTLSVVCQDPSDINPTSVETIASEIGDRYRDLPFEEGDERKMLIKAFPTIPA